MRRKARPGGGRQIETTIDGLGGRGDGLAVFQGRPVFAAYALPGERVRLKVTGERAGGFKADVLEVLEQSPARVEPPCPHFGPCGGCALQHLDDSAYRAWKAALIPEALARAGVEVGELRQPIFVPPGRRRRADLAACKRGNRMAVGFHARESHEIVDLETCLLLTPGLLALIEPLRVLIFELLVDGEVAEAIVNDCDNGLDLLLASARLPDLAARQRLAAFAAANDLARLSWQSLAGGHEPEPLAERRPPRVAFAGIAVTPPPGVFLQPSREGEQAMAVALLEAVPQNAKRILELYAGCGSFTFALAGRARVHAVEGDTPALAALWSAARKGGLAGRITVEERDLARRPVLASELKDFDVAIFDPPRAGAREQALALASGGPDVVVALSCNPNAFARDARILTDGGYRLEWLQGIDQFPWSGHLELVARFSR